jgi:hypothetical protein
VDRSSPIAGYGLQEVFAYFADRRGRATGALEMHRRDVLAGEGTRPAALIDGTASISGASRVRRELVRMIASSKTVPPRSSRMRDDGVARCFEEVG